MIYQYRTRAYRHCSHRFTQDGLAPTHMIAVSHQRRECIPRQPAITYMTAWRRCPLMSAARATETRACAASRSADMRSGFGISPPKARASSRQKVGNKRVSFSDTVAVALSVISIRYPTSCAGQNTSGVRSLSRNHKSRSSARDSPGAKHGCIWVSRDRFMTTELVHMKAAKRR